MKGKEEEKEGLERLKRKKSCCRRLLACGQNSLERERDYTESVTECAPLSTTPRQTIYVYCTTTRHRLLVFFSPLLCSLLLLFGSRLFFFFSYPLPVLPLPSFYYYCYWLGGRREGVAERVGEESRGIIFFSFFPFSLLFWKQEGPSILLFFSFPFLLKGQRAAAAAAIERRATYNSLTLPLEAKIDVVVKEHQ